jgi:hypothetical protein
VNQSSIHPAACDVEQLLRDCSVRRERRSGPGGQHRNKVETAVVITHTPTGVKGDASERRSQEQNRRMALFRLRTNLAINVRRALDSTHTTPSELWRSRCPSGRIAVNPSHDDFPALLAEALDVLHAHNADIRKAADALGCTASQLTKFLKLEPKAFVQLNNDRRKRGLRPLA